MVAQAKARGVRPKLRHLTLARLGVDLRAIVADKLKAILPNAGEFVIVTRRGKAEVQVQVVDAEQ